MTSRSKKENRIDLFGVLRGGIGGRVQSFTNQVTKTRLLWKSKQFPGGTKEEGRRSEPLAGNKKKSGAFQNVRRNNPKMP